MGRRERNLPLSNFHKRKHLIGSLQTVPQSWSMISMARNKKGMVLERQLRALHSDLQLAGREKETVDLNGLLKLQKPTPSDTSPLTRTHLLNLLKQSINCEPSIPTCEFTGPFSFKSPQFPSRIV